MFAFLMLSRTSLEKMFLAAAIDLWGYLSLSVRVLVPPFDLQSGALVCWDFRQ